MDGYQKFEKQELIDVLSDMISALSSDDSFEGNISYTVMGDGLEPGEFLVRGMYRIGNSMGQGGCVMIHGEHQP